MTPPDVVVIRGAPGVGKSEVARRLAERLGIGARVEVDTLRSMVVPVDWTNQAEHAAVLGVAVTVVSGFLAMGHRPVLVVDTFSGDKLRKFVADLLAARPGITIQAFALVAERAVLRRRVEQRPTWQFRDVEVCEKLNADVLRRLVPGETVLDTSALTPDETVDRVLHVIGVAPGRGSCSA